MAIEVVERPILFNGEMVRAILDGRKTQTRRVVKPQKLSGRDQIADIISTPDSLDAFVRHKCPCGQPGDHLWVRETWRAGVEWDDDADKACGFCRREDAEQLAYGEDCHRVTEHEFVEAAPPSEHVFEFVDEMWCDEPHQICEIHKTNHDAVKIVLSRLNGEALHERAILASGTLTPSRVVHLADVLQRIAQIA